MMNENEIIENIFELGKDYDELVKFAEKATDEIEKLDKACSEWAEVSQSNYQRAKKAEEEVEKLRKALEPFAKLFLYPYDIEGQLEFLKETNDWSEQENDDVVEDYFIRRGDIRNARKVMGDD